MSNQEPEKSGPAAAEKPGSKAGPADQQQEGRNQEGRRRIRSTPTILRANKTPGLAVTSNKNLRGNQRLSRALHPRWGWCRDTTGWRSAHLRPAPTIARYYLSGSTVVFEEPSGAGCMPGGLWPCGLSAGAPPDPVSIGPVQPCGCSWPLVSGVTVRPVLYSDWFGCLGSVVV